MIISQELILLALVPFLGLAIASLWEHLKHGHAIGLGFIVLGAFCIRLYAISLDPFLHEWDERFHALVAKRMSNNPFLPTLVQHHLGPYNPADWCCNHVWIHKPPLFLWQIALSIKVFGAKVLAVRLPSAIMGAIGVLLIYDLGKTWFSKKAGILSAFLLALCYPLIENCTGRYGLDHNDAAFVFYVLASFYAFNRYTLSPKKKKWLIITGILVGCGILVKWLSILVVFGSWFLWIVLDKNKVKSRIYHLHLLASFGISMLLSMAWQLYTWLRFPKEFHLTHSLIRRHLLEPLDKQSGSFWHHFENLGVYFPKTFPFIFIGCFLFILKKWKSKSASIFILVGLLVYLLFFSFVPTKMDGFTFPLYPFFMLFAALVFVELHNYLLSKKVPELLGKTFTLVLLGWMAFLLLNPKSIMNHRIADGPHRSMLIHNFSIMQNLDEGELKGRKILNCGKFSSINLMFLKDLDAYEWYPSKHQYDSLKQLGYTFAAFRSHGRQILPYYIRDDPSILIIQDSIW